MKKKCEEAMKKVVSRGAPTGGGARPPWDRKNTIFSGFLPLNYVICIFASCVFKLFAMWKDRGKSAAK